MYLVIPVISLNELPPAVIYTKIEAAMPDPFKGAPMARLEYVTRGIKKHKANKSV